MAYKKKAIKVVFGNKAKWTYWGLRGCSHGRLPGGFNYWVYGIKGLIALEIKHTWGDFERW